MMTLSFVTFNISTIAGIFPFWNAFSSGRQPHSLCSTKSGTVRHQSVVGFEIVRLRAEDIGGALV